MNRSQLEHIIRAAGAITQQNPLVIVGSQSILGRYPKPPSPLSVSNEADISPMDAPDKADLISGSIGELSAFHDTFGYYAHGLPPESCPLPTGWKSRLFKIENENTNGYTALCLDPLDLAASKLAAGRDKDRVFVATMLAHKLVTADQLQASISNLPSAAHRQTAITSLEVCLRSA